MVPYHCKSTVEIHSDSETWAVALLRRRLGLLAARRDACDDAGTGCSWMVMGAAAQHVPTRPAARANRACCFIIGEVGNFGWAS